MNDDGQGTALLSPLDFTTDEGLHLLASVEQHYGKPIADARRHFDRMFVLRSPFAAKFSFIGAQATVAQWPSGQPYRVNAGGTGLSPDQALVSCIGEGIEHMAQLERPDDVRLSAPLESLAERIDPDIAAWVDRHASGEPRRTLDWVDGAVPLAGRTTVLPADLCLRRQDDRLGLQPRGALSTGCAAGPSFDAAALRALLELVERDAAALWWLGGRPGRPLAADAPAAIEAAGILCHLRDGLGGRSSWLLDISTEFDIPVIASISTNAAGLEVACGIAARLDVREAVRAAILEMMQVELAQTVIAAKRREAGESALSDTDRRHVHRATHLDAEKCTLLHATGIPRHREPQRATASSVRDIVERLAPHGITVCWFDQSRADLGLPVARVLAPSLQTLPSTLITARLTAAIDACGGGARHTGGIELL